MDDKPLAVVATLKALSEDEMERRFSKDGLDMKFALDAKGLTALVNDPRCFVVFLDADFEASCLALFKARARASKQPRWILLAKDSSTRTRSSLFSLGAHDVLELPVTPVQLLVKAKQALGARRGTPEPPSMKVHDLTPDRPVPVTIHDLKPDKPASSWREPAVGKRKKRGAIFEEGKLEEVRLKAEALPPSTDLGPAPAQESFDENLASLRAGIGESLRVAKEKLRSKSVELYSLRPDAQPQGGACPEVAFALASSEDRPQHNEAVALRDLPQLWAVFHEKKALRFGKEAGSEHSWVEPAVVSEDVEVAILATYARARRRPPPRGSAPRPVSP
jgi:CheY-like chemotaxis protein